MKPAGSHLVKAGNLVSVNANFNFISSHHQINQQDQTLHSELDIKLRAVWRQKKLLGGDFSLAERTAAQLRRREGLYKQPACSQNGISNDVCSSGAANVQSRLF